VAFYDIADRRARHPDWFRSDLAGLFTLLDDGAIAPRVQRVFALDEAVEAHRLIEAGEIEGRLVLDPGLPMGAAAVDALRAASPQAAAPTR
jgi:NADPH:quinone reductase-like Zn-dependent oxidoreductase